MTPCHDPRCSHARDDDRGVSRRSLLGRLALGLGSAAVLPGFSIRRALAGPPVPSPKFLVIVNLLGGNDALNTLVPFALGEYYDARPTLAIPAASLLPISAGEGLHPSLAPIHPLFAAGEMAIVRQVGYPNPNLSHFESMDIWSRGTRDLVAGDDRGWIGRAADLYFPGALDVVGIGVGRRLDFVSDAAKPLVLDSLASYGPGQLAVPPAELAHRDAAAKAMLAAGAAGEPSPGADLRATLQNAYDLVDVIRAADAGYSSSVVYPSTPFGRSLRDVATLVKADVGTRVFYTGLSGFDSHADQPGFHPGLLAEFAASVAALREDLIAMSAWDRGAVLVITEFGRRNYQNASLGTDHGHGLDVLAIGSTVNGGLYGPACTGPTITGNEQLPAALDFRAIYSNVLANHLGVDPAPVFPEAWSGDQSVPLV